MIFSIFLTETSVVIVIPIKIIQLFKLLLKKKNTIFNKINRKLDKHQIRPFTIAKIQKRLEKPTISKSSRTRESPRATCP